MYGLQLQTKVLDQTITLNLNVRFTVTNKSIRPNYYIEPQCTVNIYKQKYGNKKINIIWILKMI